MESLLDVFQNQIGDGEIRRITRSLDADGDGQVLDDALEKGLGMLGGFLNKRR